MAQRLGIAPLLVADVTMNNASGCEQRVVLVKQRIARNRYYVLLPLTLRGRSSDRFLAPLCLSLNEIKMGCC